MDGETYFQRGQVSDLPKVTESVHVDLGIEAQPG